MWRKRGRGDASRGSSRSRAPLFSSASSHAMCQRPTCTRWCVWIGPVGGRVMTTDRGHLVIAMNAMSLIHHPLRLEAAPAAQAVTPWGDGGQLVRLAAGILPLGVNAQHAVEAEEWMLTALVSTVARTREHGAHARRAAWQEGREPSRTRHGARDRQRAGAAGGRAAYGSTAGPCPAEYALPGERLSLAAGVARSPLFPPRKGARAEVATATRHGLVSPGVASIARSKRVLGTRQCAGVPVHGRGVAWEAFRLQGRAAVEL